MNLHKTIQSQFMASLAMLEQAIERCPESLWYDESATNPFWHLAYHALFYVHLYLQPTEADFTAWAKHRENYEALGEQLSFPPYTKLEFNEPYQQAEILDYVAVVKSEVIRIISTLDLEGSSGFEWLPFSKLELQFYSMRHLQLHVGELAERLWTNAQIEVNWIGQG